jgi:hypothetical protein
MTIKYTKIAIKIPNGHKNTKMAIKLPNGNKKYQNCKQNTKLPRKIPNFSTTTASKIYITTLAFLV